MLRLGLEIWKFSSVVENTFAAYFSSVLFTLEFYLLGHLVEKSERFESVSFLEGGPFEECNLLLKKFCRIAARRL